MPGGKEASVAGPSLRESKKQRNRNLILHAAEELFSEKGYQGATVQHISERAGLSKGAIYLYFKSKEELFLTVCLKGVEWFGTSLETAAAGAGGLEERIRAVYLAYIRHSLEEPDVFCVLRDSFLERTRQNLSRETIDQITGFVKAWLENEAGLIQEGIDSGVYAEGTDPYAFSVMAWRLSTGLVELAFLEDPLILDPAERERYFETSIDMLLRGIKA